MQFNGLTELTWLSLMVELGLQPREVHCVECDYRCHYLHCITLMDRSERDEALGDAMLAQLVVSGSLQSCNIVM
jgi:hypothetical protein